MGRPKASPQILEFAALFADAVTIDSEKHLVARTGEYSIFSLLSRVAPNVSQQLSLNCSILNNNQRAYFADDQKRNITEVEKVFNLRNVKLNKIY